MRTLPQWTKHVATLVTLSASLCAQVVIENPQRLEVPEQRVQMLHRIICRVVADQLHLRGAKKEFPVTVILGEQEQRVLADEKGMFRIYLKHWDERSFAISDLQLVLQQAMIRKHWHTMVSEVVRRYQQSAPVYVGELNAASIPNSPVAPPSAIWPFREHEAQPSRGSTTTRSSRGRK